VHIDPEDAPARVPFILKKLAETEDKYTWKQKFRHNFEDFAFKKQKFFAIIWGAVMPFLSLLFVLSSRSPQKRATRFGLVVGHGVLILGIGIALLYYAYNGGEQECRDLTVMECYEQAPDLMKKFDIATHLKYYSECNNCPTVMSDECKVCFCSNFMTQCEFFESNQSALMFLGGFSMVAAALVFFFSIKLHEKIGRVGVPTRE